MKKYLSIILCGMLVLTGCAKIPKLENGQEVVVELEGKQFSTEEFYDKLKEKYGASILISLVDEYIVEKEMTDDIKKEAQESADAEFEQYKAYYSSNWSDFLKYYGYKTDDEMKTDLVKSYQQQLVLKKYVTSTIEEKEIEKYYKDEIYGEMTVRHILIKPEVKDSMSDDEKKKAKEEALAEAKLLINQLSGSQELEKDFGELAKEKSDDTGSASEGGLISNFTNESDLVEEFFDASYKLEVGKMTSEPVESEFGYHIIYKVSQNEKPALDTVRDKVINSLVTKELKADNANYIYWGGLREKYNMNIIDDVIKTNYNATMKDL